MLKQLLALTLVLLLPACGTEESGAPDAGPQPLPDAGSADGIADGPSPASDTFSPSGCEIAGRYSLTLHKMSGNCVYRGPPCYKELTVIVRGEEATIEGRCPGSSTHFMMKGAIALEANGSCQVKAKGNELGPEAFSLESNLSFTTFTDDGFGFLGNITLEGECVVMLQASGRWLGGF